MKTTPLLVSTALLAAVGFVAVEWRSEIIGQVTGTHGKPATSGLLALQSQMPQPSSYSLPDNGQKPVEVAQLSSDLPPPQTAQARLPQTNTAPQPAATATPHVDESALRYFAAQGDTARLQAEIARLKSLYPNWVPPENPLAVPPVGDPQLENMWKLYSESRYAEVRKAIVDRQQAEPDWQPPANLLDMLNLAEARVKLVNASNLKQYAAVIEIAAANSGLLTCSEVDSLWRVAEAFASTDRDGRARDAYMYVLNNCTQENERLATVQKASALLPPAMIEELLTQEKTKTDGTLEFEPVKNDLARQFIANGGNDAKLTVPPTYVSRLERVAETDGLASDALLLGWYYIVRENVTDAEKWFRKAHDKENSASASQGLTLALLARDKPQEAEEIMYEWRDASDDALKTYLAATANLLALEPPVVLDAEVLKRIGEETVKAKDPATAQEFGWYARAFQQPQLAVQWFTTALDWKNDDEPSAYGLALTNQELGNLAETRRIQQQWAGRSERIAQVGQPQQMAQGQAGYTQVGQAPMGKVPMGYNTQTAQTQVINTVPRMVETRAPAAVDQHPSAAIANRQPRNGAASSGPRRGCNLNANPQNLSSQTALQQGWCLMEANRPAEALKAFESALRSDQSNIRSDAAYGQSLAYLRMGLTDNAAVSATKGGMDKGKATELQVAILTDRALAAYRNGRYPEALIMLDQRSRFATERVDLMVIRGYAYLNMKRYADAIQIFESIAATGNRDAVLGLANARSARAAASGADY
ncbi:cellulose synthase [Agrobacterium sp.]|jgi:tetratricopeptide (TPR) repeat protein|uniref:tetratricopeptide repeat protein n=1 Tax=Agrobacterium sp. TaxID=361 RepID=UPI0028A7A5AC|nr:cellulose synthase [Agrobacterium sp.]